MLAVFADFAIKFMATAKKMTEIVHPLPSSNLSFDWLSY
jgi:hypothetical protein